tara:strand:- start:39 stop:302 length:264 start_codon:yes stop_codon:yes gene_type:complete
MSKNIEDLKNKIIYRASYRGTKEMDKLMIGFIKLVINNKSITFLKFLDEFVNMDDETLLSIKKKESPKTFNHPDLKIIIEEFRKYKM